MKKERPIKKPAGNNYILAIGIDQYLHCPRLYNAVKDTKDLIQVLTQRFQFDEANITELYDQEATKANIYTAFRSLVKKVSPTDNLIIYYSGQGEYDNLFKLGYWIPAEAELGAVEQYVSNSEILNILGAIKSHHIFIMVDSCFSGVVYAQSPIR